MMKLLSWACLLAGVALVDGRDPLRIGYALLVVSLIDSGIRLRCHFRRAEGVD
jgi:hypothetical protein